MKRIFYLFAVVFATVVVATAQDRTITGTITDNDGSAIAGAIVKVKGTKTGTFSRSNGGYTVKASTGSVLVFSSIGKKTQEVTVGESSTINVRLASDQGKESEVVVTAIGLNRSKKSLGYSTQEVGAEQITNSRESNIVNSLASRVAGVQVNNSTGVPGASSYIRIRGSSSLNGDNQPLFVVDGIPIDNSQYSSEATQAGVAYSNRAMDIDPNTIETMNVLKGPAATALYGIRAAGGAIIITTKKGRPNEDGKININVNASWAFDEVNKLPELQSKWSQGSGGKYAFSSGAARSWGAAIDTLYYNGDANSRHDSRGSVVGKSDPTAKTKLTAIDPYEKFFQTGLTQNQSVTMSGGSSAANYLISFSNLNSEGVVPNSSWGKKNVKVSSSAAVAKNVSASANLNYVNSGGRRIQQGSNISGVMLGLLRTPASFDNANGLSSADALAEGSRAYRYSDGSQRTYRNGGGYDNPFWTVNENVFEDDVNRLFGNAQIDWSVLPELTLMYRIGMDYYNDHRVQTFSKGSKAYPSGRLFTDDYTSTDITSDLILTYNVNLTDDVHLQALLGGNVYSNNLFNNYVQGDNVGDQTNRGAIGNYAGTVVGQGLIRKRTMATYTDLRFDYQNALFLNFTGRNEWSTTLPEANNSFFYPSISASAVLTELFPELKSDAVSFIKVRANYATVGKDAPTYGTITSFGRAGYSDGWTNGITFPFAGIIGYSRGNVLGSSDLRPEKTSSVELGFDIALFDGRVALDVSWYNQISDDQIFQVPIANSTGYTEKLMNAGSMRNSGIEAVLNLGVLRTNDFNWDMTVNFTLNRNAVVKLAPGVPNIGLGGFTGSSVRAVAGEAYGSIYGFGWMRDSLSNLIIDGDSTSPTYGYPMLNPNERAFGNYNPDWLMGIRNTFTWKGISLSAQLDIRQGGVMWNGTRGALYTFGTAKGTEDRGTEKTFTGRNSVTDEIETFKVTPGENWYSLGEGGGFGGNTEDFIEDASWVRLRELTLSYAIPTSIMENTPFSGLTVSFTGRNLWLSTKYTGVDPETSLQGASSAQGLDYFNMPSTKSYVFAFSLNF